MKWLGLIVLGFLAVSTAQAQELPSDVAEPYLAYSQALEARDWETARVQARLAWRAAMDADIDPETAAVLSDNYAQLAAAFQEFEDARDAYRNAAELYEEAGAGPDILAELWTGAASAALHAGDHRDAIRCADTAGDIAQNADSLDEAVRAELLFNSRAVQANAHWLNGRLRAAARRAREALGAAGSMTEPNYPRYGLVAFIDGVEQAIDANYLDGAFRLTEAYRYLPDQQRVLFHWVGYARDQLDEEQQSELLDRLSEAGLVGGASGDSDPWSDFNPVEAYGEAWVDALPVRRVPPRYPPDAAAVGAEGVALVMFTVTEEGRVEDGEILFSIPFREFGVASLRAISRWDYTPATLNGEPVRREGVITQMQFVLDN
jgi:TonB family protein